VNSTFRPLNLHGRCSRNPFNRQQERPGCRSARSGKRKICGSCQKSNQFPTCPLRSLVTIRAMLSQLVCFIIGNRSNNHTLSNNKTQFITAFKKRFSNGRQPIPDAAWSKVWACGRSLAGIAGYNPAGGIDICLFCVFCVL